MSTSARALPQTITKMKDDLKILTKERDQLNKKLLDYEADSIYSEGNDHAGIKLIKKIFSDRHQKEIKLLAKKLVEKSPDTVILFGVKSEDKAQLMFQCSENLNFDMGRLMASACEIIDGRGGGRQHQAQGGGPSGEKLEQALQHTEDMLLEIIGSL